MQWSPASAGSFRIIGHRGAAGLEPENTLRSFRRAVAFGVTAVELDVHLCEGRLVVIHDETVDRTTNGHGPVVEFRRSALRQLDAGAGEHIPDLDEVVATLPESVWLNIELKGAGTAAMAVAVARQRPMTLLSSFSHRELFVARALDAEVALAPLFGRVADPARAVARALALDAVALNTHHFAASAVLVAAAHAAGIAVHAYTVNDPQRMLQLRHMGVDGVFTDRPDLAAQLPPA